MADAPDQRRFLHSHLVACRDCVVESLQFCRLVATQGADYRTAIQSSRTMHAEFVDLVIKGRLRRIGN